MEPITAFSVLQSQQRKGKVSQQQVTPISVQSVSDVSATSSIMQKNHRARSILQEICPNRNLPHHGIPSPFVVDQMTQSQASWSSHHSAVYNGIPPPVVFDQISQSQASQATYHSTMELLTSDNTGGVSSRRPSHARRVQNGSKKGRGVIKGFSVIKRLKLNNNDELTINCSKRLGGAVGVNRRAFIDDVVVNMRQKAPLVGVEKWSKVSPSCKKVIKNLVLNKWEIEDNEENEEKINKIAGERYRSWRSTLAATYRYFASDEERMEHIPEELTAEVWSELVTYFGFEKFKKISEANSKNRSKQKFPYTRGSKSYSQFSYELRDKETEEEPGDYDLWMIAHTKGGEWTNEACRKIHETANAKIVEREEETGMVLSSLEKDKIFQSTICGKQIYMTGCGYMAKSSKAKETEELRAQVNLQAQENEKLKEEMNELKSSLAAECAERDQVISQSLEEVKRSLRNEFTYMLANQRAQQLTQAGGAGPSLFDFLLSQDPKVGNLGAYPAGQVEQGSDAYDTWVQGAS